MWFLTLSRGRDAFWVRYTIRAPVAGPPEPRLWFARFDRDDSARTFGVNAAAPLEELILEPGLPGVRMGEAGFGSGHATGEIAGGGHRVSWDLRFPTGDPTLRLLPRALSGGRLAPTEPLVPNPDTRFTGEVTVDGERTSLEEVPGQQGHLYGSRHAERWAWAHCSDYEDDYVLQAVSARGRRGPLRTPYATFAALRTERGWLRFRGMARRPSWGLGWWRVALRGRRHRLEGEVRASPKAMVRARYLDPDDAVRWCHNSEVASSRLTLLARREGGWREEAELVSDGTTHAEWAGLTPAPDVDREHLAVS